MENTHSQENQSELALKECQEKLQVAQEKYSYLVADFDNFRKRTEKDRLTWMQTAQKGVIDDVLVVLDNFDRVYADLAQLQDTDKSRFAGFELIHKDIAKFLSRYDITEITDITVFDPEYHEAVMQVADTGKEPGTIINVLKKGYKRKDSVLRPAQVSVAQ
ncbi:MAG: nucleotide exchange factor GrpE [Candidatus Babeliaceae bacterium]|jgi:molecular chaperone GrpE